MYLLVEDLLERVLDVFLTKRQGLTLLYFTFIKFNLMYFPEPNMVSLESPDNFL